MSKRKRNKNTRKKYGVGGSITSNESNRDTAIAAGAAADAPPNDMAAFNLGVNDSDKDGYISNTEFKAWDGYDNWLANRNPNDPANSNPLASTPGAIWDGTQYLPPTGSGINSYNNNNTNNTTDTGAKDAVGAIDIEAQQKTLEDIASGAVGPADSTKAELTKLVGADGSVAAGTESTDIKQIAARDGITASQADSVNINTTSANTTLSKAPGGVTAAKMNASIVDNVPVAEAASSAVSKLVDAGQAGFDPALEGTTISPDEVEEGKANTIEGALSSGAFAEAAKGETTQVDTGGLPALEDIDLMSPEVQAQVAELPEEALVSSQMNSLLQGMEDGKTPAWALPALSAVEQQLAARGMSASTVGRNALFSAIVAAALPIAQGNAQALKERAMQNLGNKQQASMAEAQLSQQGAIAQFQGTAELMAINAKLANEMGVANLSTEQQTAIYNASSQMGMDMTNLSNKQQTVLANSKWAQTATLTNVTNEQQATIANATLLAQMDMANADAITKASISNAQNFLAMDMANLNNEQQTSLVNQQSLVQAMLSNQSAENAAKQFNAASENQVNTFMTNLATQVNLQNAAQTNAMSQFNASQANAAAAQEAGLNADISKFNAQIDTQVNQFNEQIDFQRDQWNTANAQAIEQSNVQWRRQANTVDTAAANAFNQQNAMNAFGLQSNALTQLWQQLRDEAAFDQQSYITYQTNATNLYSTAIGHEKPSSASFSKIETILSAFSTMFA